MMSDVLYTQSCSVYFLSVSINDFKLHEFIQLRQIQRTVNSLFLTYWLYTLRTDCGYINFKLL